MWQLHMAVSDEMILEIGDAIIQNLDADGLLRASVEEIANLGPYPLEEVRARAEASCRGSTPRAWRPAT